MRTTGKDFSLALKGAQENGYAEADPTADIEGHDACRKIAILSSIAYNQYVDYKKIYTEGITKITLEDMRYAEAMGATIKLVAKSRSIGDKVFARVSPAVVIKSHPLANVEDVFNAIVVSGDAIGDAMFYGRGAGKLPTASAVVADIIDIVKHIDRNTSNVWSKKEYNNIISIEETEVALYIRVSTRNADEAKKYILQQFGEVKFIILNEDQEKEELAFTTLKSLEGELNSKVENLRNIASIKQVQSVIRIEE
jgi:homoserine dehydrogenase